MAQVTNDKQIIFTMKNVTKATPMKKVILKDIYISFYYGAKIGIIGVNGSGKSSLLRIMAGVDKDFTGECLLSKGYTVGMLEQEPKLDPNKTVKEIVSEGMGEVVSLLKEYEQINNKFAEDMSPEAMEKLINRQAEVQEKLEALDGWNLDSRLDLAMNALRCPPNDQKIKDCSGGEKRRVALCRLLLQAPDILLLDEPTNHLDAESVFWLQNHLKEYKGTIILITHDRYFLDEVTGWILELDRGEGIPWNGNYSSWLEQKQKKAADEQKQASQHQKTMEKELEWVRTQPKGRHAKSKARIAAYEKMLSQDFQKKQDELEIFIPAGPRLGDKVIEAKGIAKAFGDNLLYENVSFSLPPGGIVGIIGPNGAGKTTMFNMITHQLKPDKGNFEVGSTVKLGYADQSRTLDDTKTIYEEVCEGKDVVMLGNKEVNGRAYLARYGFTGTDQNKKIKDISGGERNRVHLAKMLKSGANVLLLDEPTNDLDIGTLRALEEGLLNFAGCAVVISHDRWFLDRIATHIMAFEGDSKVTWFDGNFSDYQDDRKKRLGTDVEIPKRIMYKKLTR